jgi:hypothetical protein
MRRPKQPTRTGLPSFRQRISWNSAPPRGVGALYFHVRYVDDGQNTAQRAQRQKCFRRSRHKRAGCRVSVPPARSGDSSGSGSPLGRLRCERLRGGTPDLSEDAALDYPQSAELIRGRRKIQASRAAQANRKRFTVRPIIGAGDLWVTECVLTYDGRHPQDGCTSSLRSPISESVRQDPQCQLTEPVRGTLLW